VYLNLCPWKITIYLNVNAKVRKHVYLESRYKELVLELLLFPEAVAPCVSVPEVTPTDEESVLAASTI